MKTKLSFLMLLPLILSSSAFSQITITFEVEISGMYIGPGGVHIAGQFATDSSLSILEDWNPGAAGSEMALLSGNTYQVEVTFPFSAAGKLLEFEFVRDNVWTNANGDMSEGNPGECCLDGSCGVDDGSGGFNRIITIPDCSGEYLCSWNNCASLIASASPAITVTPQNILLCKGESVQLTATSFSAVSWFPDSTLSCLDCNDPVASPDTTTAYFVTASVGNCFAIETVLVTVTVPALSISDDTLLCAGESAQLSAEGTGIISWSPDEGLSCSLCDNPLASPLSTTLYFATSSVGSCSVKDSILISVDVTTVNAGNDQSISLGESVQLNAAGASEYTWQPSQGLSCADCASPMASPLVTTAYVVTTTSDNGCKASDTITIVVTVPCIEIFFPNAFTPNGDGKNDTFGPISELNPPIKTFRIFNRWGQLIFESTVFTLQWDGTFQNKPQPLGSYIYSLELNCEGGSVLLKGEVMLIR